MKCLYFPKNLGKYRGAVPIIFRSTWERKFGIYLDYHPNIEEWSFERVFVYYFDPVSNRRRRYIPDFDVKFKDGKKFLIEIKPKKETHAPRGNKRKTNKRLYYETATWKRNEAKWKAAQNFCKKFGKEFRILTEKDLF